MSRFVVRTVTGYPIRPGAARSAGNTPLGVNYVVLDSAVCYRVMGEFYAATPAQQGQRCAAAELLAEQLERECLAAERETSAA